MLYGQLKPTVIKIFRKRWRYRLRGLPLNKPLRVIGYDIKYMLVADDRVVRVYRVPWKDIQLVESERVVQVPIVQQMDNYKVVDRRKENRFLKRERSKRDKNT
jgi:uncharacterized protein YcfJ